MSDLIEWVEITCPWCLSRFGVQVDCSAGDQQYTEDCQVCCAPITFDLRVDDMGQLVSLETERED